MGKTKLDETLYLKSALKCDAFDVAIDIKIQFFRVLVTIEPDRSLLQFVTTNCLIPSIKRHSRLSTRVCREALVTLFKQFVVTNCSKEQPGSIVNETLKNGILMLKYTSKESDFHVDFKYISFIKFSLCHQKLRA